MNLQFEHFGERGRPGKTQRDTDYAAQCAHDHRFNQKLKQDVSFTRADREANSNLARALCHRNEHDIHDADAAHQEAGRRPRRTGMR